MLNDLEDVHWNPDLDLQKKKQKKNHPTKEDYSLNDETIRQTLLIIMIFICLFEIQEPRITKKSFFQWNLRTHWQEDDSSIDESHQNGEKSLSFVYLN